MYKIAMFTTSYLPVQGGLQYETAWLLEAIDELLESKKYGNIEFYFIAPNKQALPYCNFKNIKVKNLNLKFSSKFDFFQNMFKLRKAIKNIKPNLLHCQGISPDGFLIYAQNLISIIKQKYLITSHGSDLVIIPEIKYGSRLKIINNFLSRLVLDKVEKHLLPSTALIKFAKEAGTSPKRIKVIPNGVKLREKIENKNLVQEIKKKHNIENKDFCLLSLSGMRQIKDLNTLIEGFGECKKKMNNLKLFLACEGKMLGKMKAKVEKMQLKDDIKFIGFIKGKEKDAYFQLCDVFCMTSLFETFAISLLEAMDYGKIVIATKVGGIGDFVKQNYNGILIDVKNYKQLADAIYKLYNNKKIQKSLIKNGFNTAKKYSIDNIAKKHLDLYLRSLK